MQAVVRLAATLAALGPASAVFVHSNTDVSTLEPIDNYVELWNQYYLRLYPYSNVTNETSVRGTPTDISNLTGADLIHGSLMRDAPCANFTHREQLPECHKLIPNVAYMSPEHSTYLRTQFRAGVDYNADITIGDADPTTICGVPSQTLALVHSPKAAGETIIGSLLLKQYDMHYTYFHMWNPEEITVDARHGTPRSFTHYIITMRDPLDRLRSAFNYLAVAEAELCFPLPEGGQGAFDAFAKSLNNSSTPCGEWASWVLRSPEALHVPQSGMMRGLEPYYASGMLDDLRKPNVQVYVTHVENLDADIAKLRQWLCLPPGEVVSESYDHYRDDDKYLSPAGYRSLMNAIHHQYDEWRELESIAVNGNVSLVDEALEYNRLTYGAEGSYEQSAAFARRPRASNRVRRTRFAQKGSLVPDSLD